MQHRRVQKIIKPRSLRRNGKVERFNPSLTTEWADRHRSPRATNLTAQCI